MKIYLKRRLVGILDKRRPRRTAPSSLRRKVDQVGKDARRLLKGLGVNSPDEAADGPGHTEILDALVLLGETNEGPVIEGTRRLGRLVEIIDGVAAAAEFEHRAKKAATEVTTVGKLTVREGNPGDRLQEPPDRRARKGEEVSRSSCRNMEKRATDRFQGSPR